MTPLPNHAEIKIAAAVRGLHQPGFEAALADIFHAIAAPDNLIYLAYRDAGSPLVLFRQTLDPVVFSEMESTYLPGAYRLDPYFDLHLNRVAAGAYRLIDIAPDAFHRSRYFSEYYELTTLLDEITFVAYPAPGVTVNLCLGRDLTSGKVFSQAELDTCRRLAPIMSALIESHWADLSRANGPRQDTAVLLAEAMRGTHAIALSARQAEVALLILQGHSTMSIGLRLGLSPQTVKVFRKQLYSRCTISSQAELFALMLPLLRDQTSS